MKLRCALFSPNSICELMSSLPDQVSQQQGVRQIVGQLLPPVVILMLICLAANNYIATIIWLFIFQPLLIHFCSRFFGKRNPKTNFFLIWTVSSFVLLISIFEIEVVPYLEILFYENFILISFATISFLSAVTVRKCSSDSSSATDSFNHFNWWICAYINHQNRRLFLVGLLFAFLALVYGAQLTLTTICHPVLFYETFLVPDDCSEVYQDIHLSICFTAAVYSLQIAFCLLVTFIYELFKIWMNFNSRQYKILKLNEY